jgi:sugar lactone lactonase YvrE
MRATVLCATLAVAAACQPVDKKRVSEVLDTLAAAIDTGALAPPPPPPPAASGATRTLTVAGFSTPESILHDSTQDVYFVSNINGSPTAKDNNGFISRVRPDGAVENLKFIEGGRAGVTLNAPKGLAVLGDTLWVTDIDIVRAFNARTGAPLDSVKPDSGAVFLNDIVIATTGAIYITDTGIRFDDVGNVLHPGPDRVFRIGPDRKVTVAARGDSLGWPNGITVDPVGKRFIIVSFGPAKSVLAWKPGDRAPRVVAKGVGGFDGVEVIGGKIVVSSWTDSSITRFDSTRATKIISGVPSPADIGYDAKRNRVLIPVLTGNRIEIWQLQ